MWYVELVWGLIEAIAWLLVKTFMIICICGLVCILIYTDLVHGR